MYPKSIILLLLLCFQVSTGQEQDCEKLQALYKQAVVENENKNYAEAFEILTKVEQQAENIKCYDLLWTIKKSIGNIYSGLSSYAQALDYFQQALTVTKAHPELNKESSFLLHNIGYLYQRQGNHKKAIEYYKKAYAIAKKYNYNLRVAINFADLYLDIDELEKSRQLMEEIRGKLKGERPKQRLKLTYIEYLYLKGETEEAKKIIEDLYLKTKKEKTHRCNICALKLLAQIYAKQHKVNKAIEYAKEGLQNINELDWKIMFYTELAKLYALKGEYEQSFHYKDSVIIAVDSLSKKNNDWLFQINRVRFEVQEYLNQIKQNQQKQRTERILFFVLIGVGLLVFFFVFKILKNRAVKQKQKRVIAENQQKIAELKLEQEKNEHILLEREMTALENKSKLKQEQLKNKISKKNRMLSANALYYSGRNELLGKIISSLSEISAVSKNKAINDYIKDLKSHLKTDSKWEDFIIHFEKVNPGFLKKLKDVHPQLTKRDIRFLCYLYMNLSTKEICAILNITLPAFWKRKQRLIEKMGLESEDLYDYISGLV